MIEDPHQEITSVQWVKQQFECYPDSEEKRRVYNLAEWVDLHKKGIVNRGNPEIDYTENFMRCQEQFYEKYWELNAATGRLKASESQSNKESKRWRASFAISVIALIVAIISLAVSTNA